MAINHLNTLALYHTNYMIKVVLSRELGPVIQKKVNCVYQCCCPLAGKHP